MKKKLVCLLLALAMLLALAACSIGGETTEQPAEEEKTSTEQTPAAEETTEEAAETEQPAETLAETFADSSAKIGIMTTTVTSSEEQFRLATQIQESTARTRSSFRPIRTPSLKLRPRSTMR